MKLKAIKTALSMKNKLTSLAIAGVLLVSPIIGISQPLPNDGGGIPEAPFDANMNMIFLVAGVLFAVLITVRHFQKRPAAKA